LEEYLHKATINDDKMENFATQATEQLAFYVGEYIGIQHFTK